MATSGISSDVEEECIGGGCGQVLSVADHNTEQIEAHFQICENAKENALSIVFEELRKIKAEMSEMKKNEEQMKAEMRKKMEDNKKEFDKQILELNSEFKKESEIKDVALSTLFRKVKDLEEKVKENMREVGVAQEIKMAEVNGRVSGLTETISTVVHSILEAKGSSWADSNGPEQLKKETEVLRERLKKSDRETRTIQSQLEELKIETEGFSEQLNANNEDLRVIKGQLEDEKAKNESTKMTTFHVEPSPFQQLAIPMTCFNLVTHNHLFQPSFRWTIGEIETLMAQKTFEVSSELFQWNGYPVRARAKLQLKEDDLIYMSLSLEDNGQLKDFKPIPRVFYLLKDKFAKNPKHKCRSVAYLSQPGLDYSVNSLLFEISFVHKSWFNQSTYQLNNLVEIEIHVEPSAMTQHVHSYDGTLEWNMENYSRRFQFEEYKLVYYQESPCFYTGPSGYRVQVGMFLNGFRKEGLTAYIIFLSGKFDAGLPQSFPHCTTVTLVNRKDPERSIEKTIIKDIKNKKEYSLEICKVDELADLIENDTLFCKVVIKSH